MLVGDAGRSWAAWQAPAGQGFVVGLVLVKGRAGKAARVVCVARGTAGYGVCAAVVVSSARAA